MELFSTKVRVALGVLLCSVLALVVISVLLDVSQRNNEHENSNLSSAVLSTGNVEQNKVVYERRAEPTLRTQSVHRENEHLLALRFSEHEYSDSRNVPSQPVYVLKLRPNTRVIDRYPEVQSLKRTFEDRVIDGDYGVWSVESTISTVAAVDVRREPGRWCDGDWEAQVCEVAYRAIEESGRDPFDPHPGQLSRCGIGRGCLSNLGAVMRLLNCESNLDPDSYAEGYVQGTWNESRGIAQIGNGWGHVATDEQAFDWRWSTRHVSSDPWIVTERLYPECGIKVDAEWRARRPEVYR